VTRGRSRLRVVGRHGPLFWRIYLHGVLMLVVVGIAVASVGYALRRSGWNPGGRPADYLAAHVSELAADPPLLARELARAHEAFGLEASVLAADGHLVAATPGDPGVPRGHGWKLPLRGGGTLVIHSPPHDPSRGLLFIGVVLVALALASFPLARSIAAPVEQLTVAARRLGGGDLSARANVCARGELGALGQAFDDMAARLEALVRSERELLANVSHELRTPLARIRVALDLAAEGDLERSRRYLGEIGADLAELDRLVEDVLTAARLDLATGRGGGALPLRRERIESRDLLTRAAERFREQHPARQLEVRLEERLPELDADPALLRRVLDNLLDNARKYSDEGAPVALTARAPDHVLEVEVRDRGIGIDPADMSRLFTPFFRTDRSRARGTGGVGLGLALARRIVEAHGGRITIESQPGQGTAIRFSVPATTAT
jgi:signal transduction histidine kinase